MDPSCSACITYTTASCSGSSSSDSLQEWGRGRGGGEAGGRAGHRAWPPQCMQPSSTPGCCCCSCSNHQHQRHPANPPFQPAHKQPPFLPHLGSRRRRQ
jgi:hypothetical protein